MKEGGRNRVGLAEREREGEAGRKGGGGRGGMHDRLCNDNND